MIALISLTTLLPGFQKQLRIFSVMPTIQNPKKFMNSNEAQAQFGHRIMPLGCDFLPGSGWLSARGGWSAAGWLSAPFSVSRSGGVLGLGSYVGSYPTVWLMLPKLVTLSHQYSGQVPKSLWSLMPSLSASLTVMDGRLRLLLLGELLVV